MVTVIDKPFRGIKHVHPLQQEDVSLIVDACRKVPDVKRVILFGSSVTARCCVTSDLDLYFVLEDRDPSKIPFVKTRAEQDIFWNGTPEWSDFKEEIRATGVIVYERGD